MKGRTVGVHENKRKGNELKLINLNIQEFNPPCLPISFQETRDAGFLISFTNLGSFKTSVKITLTLYTEPEKPCVPCNSSRAE